MFREWLLRVAGALGRGRRDQDLEEELRLHVALAEEEALRRGKTPHDAARLARIEAGGMSSAMETMRDRRGLPWLEDVIRDARHGIRTLRRSPGFTAVALVTLALGIGANTAIFTIVSSVVLRPLPYPNPDQLIELTTSTHELSQDEYLEIRGASHSLSAVGAYTLDNVNLTAGPRAVRALAATVDGQLLSVLGLSPVQGRLFAKGETDVRGDWFPGNPGNPRPPSIALISHELWQSAFGGRAMVGTAIEVDRRRYEVVGIMPPAAGLMDDAIDVWLPLGLNPAQRQRFLGYHFLRVVARMKPRVAVATAQADVAATLDGFGGRMGGIGQRHLSNGHVKVTSMHDAIVGRASRTIWTLQASVALVLLIACVNLANIMLARAETRRRELAVRSALGASRGRLVRQCVTEGLLLSIVGGALGLWLARVGVDAIIAGYPGSLPRATTVSPDASVLGFTLALSGATGLVFGLAPIAHTRVLHLAEALKQSANRGNSGGLRRHIRHALVVAEVAIAVTLVIGAGLLVRTAANLMTVEPGFDPSRLVTFSLTSIAETRGRTYERILEALRSLPGVAAASAMSGLPPLRPVDGEETEFANYVGPEGHGFAGVDFFQSVMSGYFETMRIPIVAGRGFRSSDATASGMVAVINERLAQRIWKGLNPVGQQLRPPWGDWVPMFTVVGVARDVKQAGVDSETGTEFYFLVDQMSRRPSPLGRAPITINIVLRTALPLASLSTDIDAAVRNADPTLAVGRIRTMNDVLTESIGRPRLLAQLVGGFACLALLLAGVGTYGVLSYLVAERRQEIGIRLALGADQRQMLGEIMRQGLRLAAAGVTIGLVGAVIASRMLAALLFGVDALDPATMIVGPVVILGIAAMACAVPAWRASRLDPNSALRGD